jgi:glycosyltransferase involved in cell wall biosynthesis
MRVLALTSLYPNPLEPHRAPFNRQQLRALASEHEVRVIAPIAWTGELAARRAGKSSGLLADRQRVCDGMTIHHPRYAYTPKVLRGWYGRFFVRSVRDCFQRAVSDFRPDVVLGCWAYPDGWAAVRLAREAGLPVAIKVQGSDVLLARGVRKRRTAEALKSADAVIAVSRNLAERAQAMGVAPERIHIVYNGVDANVFHPAAKGPAREHLRVASGEPLILFVGNLLPVKGLDVLVQALALLGGAGVKFQCAIVGQGPLKAPIQKRLQALGLGARVRFVGACSMAQLPQWYHAADLLVLPSRSEGVPNVLLEARACGTPFVASNVGGIPEISDPACLVPPGDAPALARRMQEFLAGRGAGTRQALASRSWGDSARDLSAVLRGILSAGAVPLARAG